MFQQQIFRVPTNWETMFLQLGFCNNVSSFAGGFKPLKPLKAQYQHAYSPHCSPYISYVTSWENLIKHQHISCLVIISFILMTHIFYQLVIM